jgi:hypothetical protein
MRHFAAPRMTLSRDGRFGGMTIAFSPAGKMEQFFGDTTGFKKFGSQAEHFQRYEMELIGPCPFSKSWPQSIRRP